MTTTITPIHPGEVLMEEFLSRCRSARTGSPSRSASPRRINEIVHGKRRITADTALRLARYFGTTDRWLNLQTRFDLETRRTISVEPSTGSNPSRPSDFRGAAIEGGRARVADWSGSRPGRTSSHPTAPFTTRPASRT